MTAGPKVDPIVERAAHAAADKKATEVLALDLRDANSLVDFFLLVSGQNQKQLVAIAESVMETLRGEGLRPLHIEGYPRQEWVLLDYGSLVVHIFTPRMRAYYDLERLWGGARRVPMAV
jgi:ribosome-associated protein